MGVCQPEFLDYLLQFANRAESFVGQRIKCTGSQVIDNHVCALASQIQNRDCFAENGNCTAVPAVRLVNKLVVYAFRYARSPCLALADLPR